MNILAWQPTTELQMNRLHIEKSGKEIVIAINNHEAIVLFDLLHRINHRNLVYFEDQAEERVLFDLEAVLETSISEILSSDYDNLLKIARENIRDKDEE